MKQDQPEPAAIDISTGWLSRDRALTLVLVLVTAIVIYWCYLLVEPFLTPLAWALALAVVAYPVHEWLLKRLNHKNLAALISVALVSMVLVVPMVLLAQNLLQQVAEGVQFLQTQFEETPWRRVLDSYPRLKPTFERIGERVDLSNELKQMGGMATTRLSHFLTGSIWAIAQLLITLYILFYFFRDRGLAVDRLRSLVPLSNSETDEVFARVAETVNATIYGTVVVGLVQGVIGWLLFWWMGLPAPLLWGAMTAILAMVPVLGPFVIYLPVAAMFAFQEHWNKALLTLLGGILIAAVGHFLYPMLVGQRLRLHPVLVFFAFLGGLAVFGAAGLILGPAVLALTEALVNVWRHRTADGGTLENDSVGMIPS